MLYLIIQVNNDIPATMPFTDYNAMREYVNEKLEGATVVAITENIFFARVKR